MASDSSKSRKDIPDNKDTTGARPQRDATGRKQHARLNRQIDENLRRTYDETLSEELPDRFTTLIARLKAGEGPQ